MRMETRSWCEIEDDFQDALLLGNGASIAIREGFSYSALLDEARTSGLITEGLRAVFEHLETSDFELALRVLWHAEAVNRALGVPDNRTSEAYRDIQKALITVVKDKHPLYGDVQQQISAAARFFCRFKMVASLNYDLLTYWAILAGNETDRNRLKDCFVIGGEFDPNWTKFKEPYGSAPASTLVFYPHGSLALGADILGHERKIKTGIEGSLLESITSEWCSGATTPVFVCEGTSPQKLQAIRRSHYLSCVYDTVLPCLGRSLAVYGWSFSDHDEHLLKAIGRRGSIEKVAISVFEDGSEESYKARVKTAVRKFLGESVQIEFFDSASPGCWIRS